MTFLGYLLLPELGLLRVDHISTLAALATAEGPTQKVTIKLLAQEHFQAADERVWVAWDPHFSPPPRHPLAKRALLRDTV